MSERSNDARERSRLRRAWSGTVPIADAMAVGGRTYLRGRGIPAEAAEAARLRYAGLWGEEDEYAGPAVVFPLQDEGGKLVAAAGRFLAPPSDVEKTQSAGSKSRGVFEALPGALDAEGVIICEGPLAALSVATCDYPEPGLEPGAVCVRLLVKLPRCLCL